MKMSSVALTASALEEFNAASEYKEDALEAVNLGLRNFGVAYLVSEQGQREMSCFADAANEYLEKFKLLARHFRDHVGFSKVLKMLEGNRYLRKGVCPRRMEMSIIQNKVNKFLKDSEGLESGTSGMTEIFFGMPYIDMKKLLHFLTFEEDFELRMCMEGSMNFRIHYIG